MSGRKELRIWRHWRFRPASYAVAVAIIGITSSSPMQAKEDAPHEYGPPPQWPDYKALAEQAISDKLVDPYSAKFTWPYGYHQGGFKPPLSSKVYGYSTCGLVNARNRMGGYAGQSMFVVVIDYGRVLYADVASSTTENASAACDETAFRIGLPPPPTEEAADALQSAESRVGVALRPMPEGAYVAAIKAGSPAAVAGFKPGMVISAVNGIALKDMGEAMTQVVGAVAGNVTFQIIGASDIHLFLPEARR